MIPLLDLKAQHRQIREEILRAIDEVAESNAFVSGPAVARFERSFSNFLGGTNVVALNSGTSALHLALLGLGIGPGDEVIVPAMSFIATAAAVDYAGARPVIVEIDPVTCTIDPERIEAAITPKTRAIVPVHLYGHSAEMFPILAIARDHGLAVIEDAAQAHGTRYGDRLCGTIGDIGCFSFFPGKNLGAWGEGGAVVTANAEVAEKIRMLRDWGQQEKGRHVLKGFNYRMDGIQGAVLDVKLRHLDAWNEGRRRAARAYIERLRHLEGLTLPGEASGVRHIYHVFALRLTERDRMRERLRARSIDTGIHYPRAMHEHECFAGLGYKAGAFPIAERLAREELSLPIFPELSEAQIDEICGAISEPM